MFKTNFLLFIIFSGSALFAQKANPLLDSLLETNLEAAQKEISANFGADTASFDFIYQMGRLERKRKNYLLAEGYMKRCITIDPSVTRPYGVLSVLYKIKGDYETADHYVDQALKINPNDIDFLNEKATIYYQKGDFNTSLVYVKKIDSISPNDPFFLYNIGTALNQLKRFREALPFFDKAQKLAPKDAKVYYDRGYAYKEMGMNDSAIVDLKASLLYNDLVKEDYERPKKYATCYFMSEAYSLTGKSRLAAKYARMARRYEQRGE